MAVRFFSPSKGYDYVNDTSDEEWSPFGLIIKEASKAPYLLREKQEKCYPNLLANV